MPSTVVIAAYSHCCIQSLLHTGLAFHQEQKKKKRKKESLLWTCRVDDQLLSATSLKTRSAILPSKVGASQLAWELLPQSAWPSLVRESLINMENHSASWFCWRGMQECLAVLCTYVQQPKERKKKLKKNKTLCEYFDHASCILCRLSFIYDKNMTKWLSNPTNITRSMDFFCTLAKTLAKAWRLMFEGGKGINPRPYLLVVSFGWRHGCPWGRKCWSGSPGGRLPFVCCRSAPNASSSRSRTACAHTASAQRGAAAHLQRQPPYRTNKQKQNLIFNCI